MLNDIATSIKAQLYDRVSSPLLGSFLISWCFWNWKFILILTSGLTATEKLTYIDLNLFSSTQKYITNGFIYPLIIALIIIYIYPIPAKIIYRVTRNHHRDLKKIQQTIDDDTPMPIEDARELRQLLRSIQTQHEEELVSKITENSSLKNSILTLSADIELLRKESISAQQLAERNLASEDAARKEKHELEMIASRAKSLLIACAARVQFESRTNTIEITRNARPLSGLGDLNFQSPSNDYERTLEQFIHLNALFADQNAGIRIISNSVFLITSFSSTSIYLLGEINDRNLSDSIAKMKTYLELLDERFKNRNDKTKPL